MHYHSTRGQAPILPFADAVLAGLASDGGLYVPETYPSFADSLSELADLPYAELAARLLHPFVGADVSEQDLLALTRAAYAEFRHPAIAPLVEIGPNRFVLELFWGPTLAFKDFALQLLGRLLDHLLTARDRHVTIVGATSGDTGSAAIAACRGRARMRSVILYPQGRVSDVQRRQMTTIPDANVQAVAIEGSFDDCQRLVKAMFTDRAFCEAQQLAAVNSINWLRVLAQAVYYFYAALKLGARAGEKVAFSVPTGNFGDIYAGYLARRMGLPLGPLVIATNTNDILARTLQTGRYQAGTVTPTHSPSMDIQVASNFERLLFDLVGRDAGQVNQAMQSFAAKGELALGANELAAMRNDFRAASTDDAATVATIKRVHTESGYVLDPHTAVGVHAASLALADLPPHIPQVTLATAHPAKFPAVVKDALGLHPTLPPHMADLFDRPERLTVLPNDLAAVQSFITETA